MKNIVLIGMPGCGKTTIGRMLSKKIGYSFVDMDKVIEQKGLTIDELFEVGEKAFRDVESYVAVELSALSDAVISTGGGVIVRKQNTDSLGKSGIIVFIDRPLKNISKDIKTKKRPLLRDKQDDLIKLYNERYPLYIDQSDIHIINDKKMFMVVEEILAAIKGVEESNG